MTTDLRLPGAAKSATAAAVVLVSVFLFSRPPFADHRDSLGGVVAEVLLVFGIVGLSVVASLTAGAFLVLRSPGLATAYSWLALAVLVANASLAMGDYWTLAATQHGPPYTLAPVLPIVSAIAVLPATIAQVAHAFRRRS